MKFADYYLEKHGHTSRTSDCTWWINVNQQDNYNSLHHHYRTDMIAVFYFDVPSEDSGDFVIMRNDGSTYTKLYDYNEFVIKPVTGRVYLMPGHMWHHVTPNKNPNNQKRVSISYNINVSR